jgi:hypothetical protein
MITAPTTGEPKGLEMAAKAMVAASATRVHHPLWMNAPAG